MKVEADETIFSLAERSSHKYAEDVAYATYEMAGANVELRDADKEAIVVTAVEARAALRLLGAADSRIKGAAYDLGTGEALPIAQHPFRRSLELELGEEWRIRQNVTLGVLALGIGAWATPVFVIAQTVKPHGRLVRDYRKANTVMKRMYHPMPGVMGVIRRDTGATVCSALDAVSGCNQLERTPEARVKLAITVPSGLYQLQVLPFGLMDGPHDCTAVMRRIFETTKCLEIYVDDVAIHTRSRIHYDRRPGRPVLVGVWEGGHLHPYTSRAGQSGQ